MVVTSAFMHLLPNFVRVERGLGVIGTEGIAGRK